MCTSHVRTLECRCHTPMVQSAEQERKTECHLGENFTWKKRKVETSRDKNKINKSIKYSENATTDSGRRCRMHVRTYLPCIWDLDDLDMCPNTFHREKGKNVKNR